MATSRIEEMVEEFKRRTAVPRNQGEALNFHYLDEWLRTALTQHGQQMKEERDKEWRNHLKAVFGTELYELHEKHLQTLDQEEV
jgi:hypothetical protein